MPNYGYHLSRALGHAVRRSYRALLPAIVARTIKPPAELPFEVYSYSGENTLPEQVASLRSLLRYGGRPKKFTIVSDGTYSPRSIDLLQHLDPCVVVSPASDWLPANAPAQMASYLRDHPTGRQLALIMSLPVASDALYIDSDVLFFAAAREQLTAIPRSDAPAFYLADCQFSGDERLLRDNSERQHPVNTGVLFLRRALDWSPAVARFLTLAGTPSFFTNQTLTHLAMHANGAAPLDPQRFVLQLDDQFIFTDRYAGPGIVLRHYVNPVRHKLWTSLRR